MDTEQSVYFLQIGEVVKIGTTRNIVNRLAAYPPNQKMLKTVIGGRDAERFYHRMFSRHLAFEREWFHADDELVSAILSPTLPIYAEQAWEGVSDIGNVIMRARKKAGLTQQGLGEMIGSNRDWVLNVENGREGASLSNIEKLLNKVGLHLEIHENQII